MKDQPQTYRCGWCSTLVVQEEDLAQVGTTVGIERLSPQRLTAIEGARQLVQTITRTAEALARPDLPQPDAALLVEFIRGLQSACVGHGPEFLAAMMVVDTIEAAALYITRGELFAPCIDECIDAVKEAHPECAERIDRGAYEAAVNDWIACERAPGGGKWKSVCEVLDRAGIRAGHNPRLPTSPETLRREWRRWRDGKRELDAHMKNMRGAATTPVTRKLTG